MASEEVRLDVSCYIKVVESKDVKKEDFDSYSILKVDGKEVFRTKIVYNSSNPFWDEEYLANLENGMKDFEVVVWDAKGKMFSDQPLGKIVVNQKTIRDQVGVMHEKWLPLYPAENEGFVKGDIKLGLTLNDNSLTVHLLGGRDLAAADVNRSSDPYVVFHLLPDANGATEQKSKIKKKTLNPKYDEKFEFKFPTLLPMYELVCSVWDWDRFTEDDFLGYFVIPLADLPIGKTHIDWFTLRPQPEQLHAPKDKTKEKEHSEGEKEGKEKEKSDLATDFVKQLQLLPTELEPPKVNLGSIRIKYKYTEDVVLPSVKYEDFMKVICDQQYLLPVYLGKVSTEREDAAWALVKYFQFYGDAVTFLSAIINHEVETTLDANTIFRGNSMSSKAVDVYMKLIGLGYLKETIGDVIKEIITSKKSFEVDPTRLEKGDDLKKHWKQAKETVTKILEAIFKSKDKVPAGLSTVFANLKASVKKKWPEDQFVQYTAVSGFIFLRLFVAAILSPNLFGLWEELPDPKSSRNLTIVSKTVQNLANLVPFGQKEAFMEEMNEVINAKIPDMKKFIEDISVPKNEKVTKSTISKMFAAKKKETVSSKALKGFMETDLPKESSKIYHHFEKNFDKIVEEFQRMNLNTNLVDDLRYQLDQLKESHTKAKIGLKIVRKSKANLEDLFLDVPESANQGEPSPRDPLSSISVSGSKANLLSPVLPPTSTKPNISIPTGPPPPPGPAPPGAPTPQPPVNRGKSTTMQHSQTVDSLASVLDNTPLKIDFTPVEISRLTTNFSPRYAFEYFDRTGSGKIAVKDLHIILNAQGVSTNHPKTLEAFKKFNISNIPTDQVEYADYEKLLVNLNITLPTKEEINESIKILANFFGKDPLKGFVSVDQANKIFLNGETKLPATQLNQISSLVATSGAERGGQVNLNVLLNLDDK